MPHYAQITKDGRFTGVVRISMPEPEAEAAGDLVPLEKVPIEVKVKVTGRDKEIVPALQDFKVAGERVVAVTAEEKAVEAQAAADKAAQAAAQESAAQEAEAEAERERKLAAIESSEPWAIGLRALCIVSGAKFEEVVTEYKKSL